jgi:3-oxoacyl-ACP reductase-like protein
MQPGSWASALKKNLKLQSTVEQNTRDAANADLASTQDAILRAAHSAGGKSTQPPGAQPSSKAAARQKLLNEALKSRANAVTGKEQVERRVYFTFSLDTYF